MKMTAQQEIDLGILQVALFKLAVAHKTGLNLPHARRNAQRAYTQAVTGIAHDSARRAYQHLIDSPNFTVARIVCQKGRFPTGFVKSIASPANV